MHEVDGEKYFFGRTTYKVLKGLIDYNGNLYYADKKDGKLNKGLTTIDNSTYFFDEDSCIAKVGWIRANDNTYYANLKTKKLYNLVHEVDGEKYFFGRTTYKVLKGWIDYNGDLYYANPETGILNRGVKEVDGKTYFFGVTGGVVQRGWIHYQGKVYYSDIKTGVLQTGIKTIDNNSYNFGQDYVLKTGWQTINNNRYYFFANGSKALGMQKIEGSRYLFNDSGEMLKENVQLWIDVSYAQGDIDWDALWDSGEIDGVIIRIGSGAYVEDKKLARNIAAVKRLNIPYTTYYFSYAENVDEALQEARNMMSLYKKYGIVSSLPSYYDVEYFSYMSKEQYQSIIETYKNYCESNGVSIKVYANKNFGENLFNEQTRSYLDWIAHYTGTNVGTSTSENIYSENPRWITNYSGNWRMWQYSNNGHITGISGRVDLNLVL